MSNDDLIARLNAIGSRLATDPTLAHEAAAAIRKLEGELAEWMQRAERQDASIIALEAERDALRALLRDCLPVLDGEGVTIHRVWAALSRPEK